jgi:hypothetical protein
MTARDLLVLGGILVAEPRSLAALWRLATCLPRTVRSRRIIMSRRLATDQAMANWFSFEPAASALRPAMPEPGLDADRVAVPTT